MDPSEIAVIAPNLKRRLSGVTATTSAVVPVQALSLNVRATGPGLPPNVPQIPLWQAILMPRDRWRVWHARRNNEMMLGVFLRYVLRRKYKLIFTSSSPRERGGLTKWLVAKMDHLIATNALNAAVMPGAPSIVPHGVDPAVFTPRAAEKAPRARKSIGCIGRIRPKKGTAEFVRAMCLLLPEFEGWDAHIFGRVDDDAYEKALRAMCEKAGVADRVIFHAPRPIEEMPDIYRSLDIVVAPSHLEGFGLTPIEAGACGVPCIASRGVGCFDEAIIAGKTGDLAAVGDADSFARAIRPFMADDKLRQSAGKMARDHIVSNFSIAIEAAALNDVYKRLLANG